MWSLEKQEATQQPAHFLVPDRSADCNVICSRGSAEQRPFISVARIWLSPYRPRMGQQHRVRTKRRRRLAYRDRKKVAAKSAPARRETPKAKSKPKKAAAAAAET